VEHDVDLETVQNETTRPATKSALHELDLAQQTTPLSGMMMFFFSNGLFSFVEWESSGGEARRANFRTCTASLGVWLLADRDGSATKT